MTATTARRAPIAGFPRVRAAIRRRLDADRLLLRGLAVLAVYTLAALVSVAGALHWPDLVSYAHNLGANGFLAGAFPLAAHTALWGIAFAVRRRI